MKRAQVSKLLRMFGLIYFTDWLRFHIKKFKNRKENNDFKINNPDIILPPDYLIYESFQMNYKKYYTDSIDTAKWLANHFKKHIELKNVTILDWGCGPARIIRHLPNVINNNCKYYGTDYNKKTIVWCKQNLKNIHFNLNTLEAKLPYKDNFMDVVYGISIFTHLSEKMHYDWFNELYRVLKPNGIMFITTQGTRFKVKLTNNELIPFEKGNLIVRGNVKEGHRTYSAFHPKKFMHKLFENMTILEHIESQKNSGKNPAQDIWIIRK